MDFAPSSAQQLLAATARDFLRRHSPAERVQAWALDPHGLDEALWRRMAELGWQGLLVPPALGGSGGSLLDVTVLVEEMGYAALPGPFVTSAVVVTSLLMHAGSAAQQERLLPALAAGDQVATLALVEEHGTAGADDVALAARVPGQLTGRKLFVESAHVAGTVVVVAREDRGPSLLLLPADRPGLARVALDVMSGEKLFEVAFDGVDVTDADRLGPAGQAVALLAPALRAGALARTAEMVGGARRILDLAVEHAKARVQGGRPIGGYQAIQHACADLVRDVDTARGLLHLAAWKAAEGLPAEVDIAMAKAHAAEACLSVARRGHQIFGAIGYCEEHPLHLIHKRIQAASLDCGDRAHHLETVARSIGLA